MVTVPVISDTGHVNNQIPNVVHNRIASTQDLNSTSIPELVHVVCDKKVSVVIPDRTDLKVH